MITITKFSKSDWLSTVLISALVIKQIGRPILLITHMIACVAAGPHTCLNHLYSLYIEGLERLRRRLSYDYKQLLNEVFVISGIIKVEVSVISRSRQGQGFWIQFHALSWITLNEVIYWSCISAIQYSLEF